jgi:hypothetical protein
VVDAGFFLTDDTLPYRRVLSQKRCDIMNKSTQLKMIVCGVALVSLSAIRPASAQVVGSGACSFDSGGFGSGTPVCVFFNTGPQTERVDYPGNHSFKVIVNALKPFFLDIIASPLSPPGPVGRYPDPSEVCIPYVFATSDTSLGSCSTYDVRAFDGVTHELIPPENAAEYFSGKITYRIAWNFPTLAPPFDNPRGLRAETDSDPFNDLTAGVFPTLQSGQDPGVDTAADGFSQYIVVQQPHALNGLAGCLAPLNCSDPTNASANVFNAGQTIPVKVVLNPANPAADLRLTYRDPAGIPHLAQASGRSNIGNTFRTTGNHFEFNWSTKGLAPGIYQLTIAPGTTSGGLFAPTTILVTLQ